MQRKAGAPVSKQPSSESDEDATLGGTSSASLSDIEGHINTLHAGHTPAAGFASRTRTHTGDTLTLGTEEIHTRVTLGTQDTEDKQQRQVIQQQIIKDTLQLAVRVPVRTQTLKQKARQKQKQKGRQK